MEEDFQTEKERYSEYSEDEVNFMTSWLTAIKEFNNFINTVPIVTKKEMRKWLIKKINKCKKNKYKIHCEANFISFDNLPIEILKSITDLENQALEFTLIKELVNGKRYYPKN